MPLQVGKQRAFVDDLATRQIHQDGVLLHQGKFTRTNAPHRRVRERGGDDEHIRRAEQHLEVSGRADPLRRCGGVSAPVDGMDRHPHGPHEPRCGDANPPEPEDPTDPSAQHSVRRKLMEGPVGQMVVLDEEPLRGRERHGERMLRHRFRERTPVRGDGAIRRQGLQGDKIDTSRVELQQPHRPNEREFVCSQILRRIAAQK